MIRGVPCIEALTVSQDATGGNEAGADFRGVGHETGPGLMKKVMVQFRVVRF
jgi:hypothetical protein